MPVAKAEPAIAESVVRARRVAHKPEYDAALHCNANLNASRASRGERKTLRMHVFSVSCKSARKNYWMWFIG